MFIGFADHFHCLHGLHRLPPIKHSLAVVWKLCLTLPRGYSTSFYPSAESPPCMCLPSLYLPTSLTWLLVILLEGFSGGTVVKNLPAMQEMWVISLEREDPLEKGMATHSSILAWKIPWTEEPGRLQSMGSQRVGHDWACMHVKNTMGILIEIELNL